MEDIKIIIADNINSLRKKNNMTQGELAERLNYSDNAVSRWERGDATPSIETLQQIAEIFSVPIEYLLKQNSVEAMDKDEKKQTINKIATTIISVSVVWFVATIAYVYGELFFHTNFWMFFCYAVPVSCLVMLPFQAYWGGNVYRFVILTVLQWSILACIFLQFIEYHIWLVFIIGIPIQVALCTWAFIKPKKNHTKSNR